MKRIPVLLYIIFLLVAFSDNTLAQSPDDVIRDETVCFKYNFQRGDTLVYRVVGYDSVIVDFDTPLLRNRFERWVVICDSTNKSGSIFLTITLVDYLAFESKGGVDNIRRETSPWLQRKVQIEIDTLGNRLAYSMDDPAAGAVAPGGSFQPTLFLPFTESCKKVNQSWLVSEYEYDLPENGNPPGTARSTFLFRVGENLDTLNEASKRFQYVETAQTYLELVTNNENMKYSAVINAAGVLTFSQKYGIPNHFHSTREQKLTIESSDGRKKPAWHYIEVFYTLDDFRHQRSSE